MFWLTAALCAAGIGRAGGDRPRLPFQAADDGRPADWQGLGKLFRDRRLLIFTACVVLLLGTRRDGSWPAQR